MTNGKRHWIVQTAVDRVEAEWGKNARDNVGPAIYAALITERVFYIIAGQDDSVSGDIVKKIIKEAHEAIIEETN